MKALLAFAIELVMLVSATIVMDVAVAEGEELDGLVDENGEGLIIAPGADDGSTDTDDGSLIAPPPGANDRPITDDQMVWGEPVKCFLCADGEYHCTGLLVGPPGPMSVDQMPVDQAPYSEQLPDPLSDSFWAFNKISGAGIPDMFIDMDDIFRHIDIPTWQPKKLPEPELFLIYPEKRPDGWIGLWPPDSSIIIDPDTLEVLFVKASL